MTVDLNRRKAVMARSIKLGHCVCNPKKPCPCDIFEEFNVCQCAGEKLPVKTGPVALTRHVRKAGCASKIGQADLLRILSALPPVTDPNVLVGAAAGDDAGVYRLDDRYSLVQTVDVFTPCVDDPYLFGRIAAANSVSDVYAMGGRPLTALSIVGFPIDDLDGTIMEQMLKGGIDTLAEAGCVLVGGHSINDEEIKLGFAVTGLIESGSAVERAGARPGDVLVLTKPLGTGMISFGAQIGRISDGCLAEVGESMAALNRDAAELMVKYDAHACTDVTGFGLAGHLVEMARGSGVSVELDLGMLPVFGAVEMCIKNDILSGAIERNQEYSMAWVDVADPAAEPHVPVLYDPQTSGGLLVSMSPESADGYVAEMKELGHAATTVVGRVIEIDAETEKSKIIVVGTELKNFIGTKETAVMSKNQADESCCGPGEVCCDTQPEDGSCCTEPEEQCCCPPDAAPAVATDALAVFRDFMKEANKPGLIDGRAKKLMAIALSISQRCEPCLAIHMRSAISMGISKDEIDEAANLAIAFGGCTAMMFYKDICGKLKL
jgi:selenide,water dikinase